MYNISAYFSSITPVDLLCMTRGSLLPLGATTLDPWDGKYARMVQVEGRWSEQYGQKKVGFKGISSW